ncbi:hypothetical protein FRUB_03965 [Fimbriiglobus ruber]|uniref:Uncharacterized protein n=1 Tax=Fimbriiglobus ruber TaxID=1908690 RepID=A0A225E0K3_9BACT|nr:hypothetical protein FRUB_03965 [Fimbriiglobus ruber]
MPHHPRRVPPECVAGVGSQRRHVRFELGRRRDRGARRGENFRGSRRGRLRRNGLFLHNLGHIRADGFRSRRGLERLPRRRRHEWRRRRHVRRLHRRRERGSRQREWRRFGDRNEQQRRLGRGRWGGCGHRRGRREGRDRGGDGSRGRGRYRGWSRGWCSGPPSQTLGSRRAPRRRCERQSGRRFCRGHWCG